MIKCSTTVAGNEKKALLLPSEKKTVLKQINAVVAACNVVLSLGAN